jgi:hypothetical protein
MFSLLLSFSKKKVVLGNHMGRERIRPVPVGEVLRTVMQDRGLGAGGSLAKLMARWPASVGADIARHACPAMLKGGRLTVTVDSSAWMGQLSMLAPGIIEKVNEAIGEDLVKNLHFRIGKIRQECPAARAEDKPPARRRLMPLEKALIEKALEPIKDEELRSRGRRLMSTAFSTRRKDGDGV